MVVPIRTDKCIKAKQSSTSASTACLFVVPNPYPQVHSSLLNKMLLLKHGIPKQEFKVSCGIKRTIQHLRNYGGPILEDYLFYAKIFRAKVETREKKE